MSKIQAAHSASGANLYAVVRDGTGQAYRADTQAFEAYVTANLTSTKYALAMTEQGTASRYYAVNFPSLTTPGLYFVAVYVRAGGAPAEGDALVRQDTLWWDGATSNYGVWTYGFAPDTQGGTTQPAVSAKSFVSTQTTEVADWPLNLENLQITFNGFLNALNSDTADGSIPSLITLGASASSTDNIYKDCLVVLTSGTGAGQARLITAYVGLTKVAVVTPDWVTTPNTSTTYVILPASQANVALFADWNVQIDSTSHTPIVTPQPDLYHADIKWVKDSSNARDEFAVIWYKNGVQQTSGVTVPTIEAFKWADGTDLIASTAMSAVGSTGYFKYSTGSLLMTDGEMAFVKVTATIDGSTRTFSHIVGRDS